MDKKCLGRHLIVEFYDCDKDILTDNDKVEELMNLAAEEAGATIVESVFHHFSPWGVSGVVVIAESHLTIHTWPEHNYAAVDFFTCGDIDPMKSCEFLKKQLKSDLFETKEINRGILSKIRKTSF